MSSVGYKRTNFEDDEASNNGAPGSMDISAGVVFKGGISIWKEKTILEQILIVLTVLLSITVVVMAIVLASKETHIINLTQSSNSKQLALLSI